MRKKINHSKIFCFAVIGIFAIFFIFLAVYFSGGGTKSNFENYCYDYKEIFSEEQRIDINNQCKTIKEEKGISILVATCDREFDTFVEINGVEFCEREGFDCMDNFIVIIINAIDKNKGHHFDIYTFGDTAWKVTDNEILEVLYSDSADKIIYSSKSDLTAISVKEMASMLATAYTFILPYKVSWTTIIVGSAIISLIVALIVTFSVKLSYTRKRKNQTYSLSSNTNLNLIGSKDNYIRSVTTSVVISSGSSGGGSGGRSGGFSGGRSGGGSGGGHRGGR